MRAVKPDSPPPSPIRGSIISHRKRRAISSGHENNPFDDLKGQKNRPSRSQSHEDSNVFVDDVKIAAAIKTFTEQQLESDYYTSIVKDLCNSGEIDLPHHMLCEVTRAIEKKFSMQEYDNQHLVNTVTRHYMTQSPERDRRFRKCKAIMKRPPSLAPTDSPIYNARTKLKARQLEKKTIIDQKVNEVLINSLLNLYLNHFLFSI